MIRLDGDRLRSLPSPHDGDRLHSWPSPYDALLIQPSGHAVKAESRMLPCDAARVALEDWASLQDLY